MDRHDCNAKTPVSPLECNAKTPVSLQIGTNVTPNTGFASGGHECNAKTPVSRLTCFHRPRDTSAPPSEPSPPRQHRPPPETGMHYARPRPPRIRPIPAKWRQARPGRFRPAVKENRANKKIVKLWADKKTSNFKWWSPNYGQTKKWLNFGQKHIV